jgi:hypothetical protein
VSEAVRAPGLWTAVAKPHAIAKIAEGSLFIMVLVAEEGVCVWVSAARLKRVVMQFGHWGESGMG